MLRQEIFVKTMKTKRIDQNAMNVKQQKEEVKKRHTLQLCGRLLDSACQSLAPWRNEDNAATDRYSVELRQHLAQISKYQGTQMQKQQGVRKTGPWVNPEMCAKKFHLIIQRTGH